MALDIITLALAKKHTNKVVEQIGDSSPKGVYPTLSDLETAHPSGENGVFVVADEGKWYYWDGADWIAGGFYQEAIGVLKQTDLIDDALTDDSTKPVTASVAKVQSEYASYMISHLGEPLASFDLEVELIDEHPNGDSGYYHVSENDMWYYWDGTEWVKGGVYQGTTDVIKRSDIVDDIEVGGEYKVPNADITSTLNAMLTEKTRFGVVSGLVVIAQSSPDMTVKVISGGVYVQNGKRFSPASVEALIINTSDNSNPRIDIVYVNSSGGINYSAGTPSNNPFSPSVPAGGVLLAEIYVDAGITEITDNDIIDKRQILEIIEDSIVTNRNTWSSEKVLQELGEKINRDEIVNDAITDDATKPVSASVAKEISEEVGDLGEKVNKLSEKVSYLVEDENFLEEGSLVDDYNNNCITVFTTDGTGWDNKHGIVITYKIGSVEQCKQELIDVHNRISVRRVSDDGSWTDWHFVNGNSSETEHREPYPYVGYSQFDETLGVPIWCKEVGVSEVAVLTIESGAIDSGNITISLNDVDVIVAVEKDDTIEMIESKIKATSFDGWNISGDEGTGEITFTSIFFKECTEPVFDDTDITGVSGVFNVVVTGEDNIWVNAIGDDI